MRLICSNCAAVIERPDTVEGTADPACSVKPAGMFRPLTDAEQILYANWKASAELADGLRQRSLL